MVQWCRIRDPAITRHQSSVGAALGGMPRREVWLPRRIEWIGLGLNLEMPLYAHIARRAKHSKLWHSVGRSLVGVSSKHPRSVTNDSVILPPNPVTVFVGMPPLRPAPQRAPHVAINGQECFLGDH